MDQKIVGALSDCPGEAVCESSSATWGREPPNLNPKMPYDMGSKPEIRSISQITDKLYKSEIKTKHRYYRKDLIKRAGINAEIKILRWVLRLDTEAQ